MSAADASYCDYVIVVDIGCHPQGPEESVHKLIERFQPAVLFGFDPYPELEEGIRLVDGTVVILRRRAAWVFDGEVPLRVSGITTGIDNAGRQVASCFDLARWLTALPKGVVLKIDAEGAERLLLHRMRKMDVDKRLSLLLVEWHPPETAHGYYCAPEDRPVMQCPVEAW